MICRLLALASLLILTACQQERDPAAPPSPAIQSAKEDVAPLDAESLEAKSRYVVKEGTLDKYIAYQDKTMALYSALLEQLGKAEGQDGGTERHKTVALFRKHADAQEKVRREVGLSARDVYELERIVGDVISKRAVSPPAEQLESLRRMEELALQIPEAERPEFEKKLGALREAVATRDPLVEERRKYGDDNVDLVLTREKPLTRQWNHAISTFAGTAAPRPDGVAAAPGPSDGGGPSRASP